MSTWAGSGLAGPAGAPGVRLGLPAAGHGSIATLARRVAAFAVDAIGSALIAGAFTAPELPRNWSLLVFSLEYVFFTAVFGQTPGMRVSRIRVIRLDNHGPLGLLRALVRTTLLVLLVPALITDRDRRGLHDKLAVAAVVES